MQEGGTCDFDRSLEVMIRIAAGDLGRIFSEGDKWGELELNTFRAGVGEEGLLQRSQGVGGPKIN